MLEVLVTLIIVTVGLLGLAGLNARAHISELESYQRAQALVMVSDMVERIRVIRVNAPCFAITTASAGSPVYGANSAAFSACTAASGAAATLNNTLADDSKTAWDNLLKGSSETSSSGGVATNVGAMIGARGCVSYNAGSELISATSGAPMSGTGIYTVSVAWQGMSDTVANVNFLCGTGLFGAETKRRVVSNSFRIANLTLN